MATLLANTCTTEYDCIYEKFAKTICRILKIKPQYLIQHSNKYKRSIVMLPNLLLMLFILY